VGTYTATVDRTGLADGSYLATITFTSNGGTVLVPVVMQVGTGTGGGGDAGFHYVLLIDPSDLSTVAQVALGPTNGSYDYAFTDIPSGSYFIVAGTDSDNDFFICDTGEACGGYPIVNDPAEIVVDGDRTGLDFATGFEVNLGGTGAGAPVHLVPTTGFRVRKKNP
jgi:serine protease